METLRAEILLLTRNLPPLVGGMETLLYNSANCLAGDYRLTVVGPRGCAEYFPAEIECLEAPRSLALFLLVTPFLCLWAARGRHFRALVGGSGLMAPCLWLLSKILRVPTTCFIHGLDIVVASRIYQALFLPCVRRMNFIIANSSNTRGLCIERGVEPTRITVIPPGCGQPTVNREAGKRYLEQQLGRQSDFLLLFVGRVVPRKGLLRFMREAFADLLQRRPGTVLAIVGEEPVESLAHRSAEMSELTTLVEQRGWGEVVRFLGKVDDAALSLCYSGADCLLFPLVPVAGDVEGFGMVAIEAAAHGLQTVAFAEGGVVDAVAAGASGYLVQSGDYPAMVQVLTEVEASPSSGQACRAHAAGFSWENFGEKLRTHMNAVLNKG